MTETTAIDGATAAILDPPPTPPEAPAKATPSPARRGGRWLVVAVLLFVFGGAAIWYNAAVIRAHPVGYDGGESGVLANGVVSHDDPFATRWYEVPYQTGGTVHIEFNIYNAGRFDAHIQQITFLGLATDSFVSPLYRANPLDAVGGFPSSQDLHPFRPFTLPAGRYALIAWDVTMCPTLPTQPGFSEAIEWYEITYTYLGWTRTFIELLPTPLQITNVGRCLANGTSS
jgi:hypothetical protein